MLRFWFFLSPALFHCSVTSQDTSSAGICDGIHPLDQWYWLNNINYSCPLGRWVSKYSSVCFSSVENLQATIGCSGSHDICCHKENSSEIQAMFCVRILPSLCGFPSGSSFCLKGLLFAFKFTIPLCDVSRLCDVSIIDLSKMIRGIIPSIPSSF